jgi:hypothetical protein
LPVVKPIERVVVELFEHARHGVRSTFHVQGQFQSP